MLRGRYRLFAQSTAQYSARAVRLVESSVVVDLLNQFQFQDFAERPPKSEQWLSQPGTFTAADAARYQGSGITVFALGAGAGDYDNAMLFHARWNGFLAGYSDWFTRIDDITDFARAKAQQKVGVMLTFQDSTHFRSPDDVRTFFGLGQRISQLTYNFNNRIGSGFLEERDGGLSVFGLSIMERMQQVGMAVDVSHCGDQTTLDALAAAKKPVIFTHATARALVPGHLRCKTDEAIRKMAKTGGVMGIAMIRFMVRRQRAGDDRARARSRRLRREAGRGRARRDRQRSRRRRQPERDQRRRLRSADAAELLAATSTTRTATARSTSGASTTRSASSI